jgi:hypothetical protein
MKTFKYLFTLFIVLVTIFSCTKDEYDLNRVSKDWVLDPALTIPLAHGTFTIDDFLKKFDTAGYFGVGDSNLMYIHYPLELASIKAADSLKIPSQPKVEIFLKDEIPAVFPPSNSILVNRNKDFYFKFKKDEKIDSMYLKHCSVDLNLSSSFKHTGSFTVTFPSVTKNGHPLSQTILITSSDGSFSYSKSVDFDGCRIAFSHNPVDSSSIPVQYTLTLNNSGNGFSSGQELKMESTFKNLDYSLAYGYMGQYEILSRKDSILIDLFNNSFHGMFDFFDPYVTFTSVNSYGVPIDVTFSNVSTYSKKTGTRTDIIMGPSANPIKIGAPDVLHVGKAVSTKSQLDRTNSNIDVAMRNDPNYLIFNIAGKTNPSGPGTSYNFVTDTSHCDVDLEVVLPLWFKSNNLTFDTIVDFNVSNELDTSTIRLKNLKVGLQAENWLPVDIHMQVYFLDTMKNTLDSMFLQVKDGQVLSGTLDGSGKVVQPSKQLLTSSFSEARCRKIQRTKFAKIVPKILTSNNGTRYVKVFSYYTLKFQLGIEGNAEIRSKQK